MPVVSVIVPAYRSHETIAAALESLIAQSRPADEIIVVDSSPDDATWQIARNYEPRITLIRSGERLYPHEARNLGAQRAIGELHVFTDPDIVAHPEWLAHIELAYQTTGHTIIGGVDCMGRRWLDVGVHLCKFDNWLPGGPCRTLDVGPSINFSVSKAAFGQVGGFPDDRMLGDTTLSWALREAGNELWFEPRAVVAHHHDQNIGNLFRERFRRGREFGLLRMAHNHWPLSRVLIWWLISILPLRLIKLMARRVRNGARAGWLGWYALTWPVVLVGEVGWLWGESAAYWAALRGRS